MKKFVAILLTLILTLSSVSAFAALPKKIEVQLPAKAGGGTDVAARMVTDWINKNSNSNLTIKNNTDGGGVVAYETIRTAKDNASKILFFHTTMLIKHATGIYEYSPADEFKIAGVGLPTEKGGYVLVVPQSSGITTLDEFIAKAKETELRIGVETGGSSHIMSGMVNKELGISLRIVESGPDTEKLTNLVGGSIDCALVNANQAKQYIEGDKVNAIACFSATAEGGRNSVLPEVPSFCELGYNLVFGTYFYVMVPKTTSDEIARELHDVFEAAASDAETKEMIEKAGFGMEIAPFEQSQDLCRTQQESLVVVCQELGLAQ